MYKMSCFNYNCHVLYGYLPCSINLSCHGHIIQIFLQIFTKQKEFDMLHGLKLPCSISLIKVVIPCKIPTVLLGEAWQNGGNINHSLVIKFATHP